MADTNLYFAEDGANVTHSTWYVQAQLIREDSILCQTQRISHTMIMFTRSKEMTT
jgi:hypothetical protein